LPFYHETDGNIQKTFPISTDLHYLLKTTIDNQATTQLFRQDSALQNTKTAIVLRYYKNYNTRFYVRPQTTESSTIKTQTTLRSSIAAIPIKLKLSFKSTNVDCPTFTTQTKNTFAISTRNGEQETNHQSENNTKALIIISLAILLLIVNFLVSEDSI
jgi:hypothetical protein